MILLHANGSVATPALIMHALRGIQPTEAWTSQSQCDAWESAAIEVSSVVTKTIAPGEEPGKLRMLPRTLAGIPLFIDVDMPCDVIEFRDKDGRVLSRIRGLGLPNNLAASSSTQSRTALTNGDGETPSESDSRQPDQS